MQSSLHINDLFFELKPVKIDHFRIVTFRFKLSFIDRKE